MRILLLFIFLPATLLAQGPPGLPTPPAVIYGNVRSSTGTILDDPNGFTALVLFANGLEIARSPVEYDSERDENFRLTVPAKSGESDDLHYTIKLERDSVPSSLDQVGEGHFVFRPTPGALSRFDFSEKRDRDFDGLPDEWEDQFGINLLPQEDPDYDGLTNCQELRLGTNPLDFHSQINFEVVRELEDGRIEIAFDAVARQRYVLQGSPTISDWAELISYYSESEERVTLSAPAVGFYRIMIR